MASEPTPSLSSRNKPLVLMVDDDRMMRMMLRRILVAADFDTIEAENGIEAITQFETANPDIVVLDVMMPEKDGFETCQEIRQQLKNIHVPILMMTGLDDMESINKAYDCGATDFVTKPINFNLLVHRIKYMLRSSKIFVELADKREQLIAAQKIANLGNWSLDLSTGLVSLSSNIGLILDIGHNKPIPLESFLGLLKSPTHKNLAEKLVSAKKSTTPFSMELDIETNNGSKVSLYIHGATKFNHANKATSIEGLLQDITPLKRAYDELHVSEEKFGYLFQYSNDAIIVHDDDGNIVDLNQKALSQFGFTSGGLNEIDAKDLYATSAQDYAIHVKHKLESEGHIVYDIDFQKKNGEIFPAEVSASRFRINNKFFSQLVIRDVTERKQAEQQISFLAYQDPLTLLPNRRLFDDRLTQAIYQASRQSSLITVLFMDLDLFKRVNDTLGHALGDKLLIQVGDRLQDIVRNTDSIARVRNDSDTTLARLGGDEFTILLTGINNIRGAALVAGRIIEEMNSPFMVDNQEVFLSTSIGLSIYPQDGETPEQLIKNAEGAMYHAKNSKRGTFHFYSSEINETATERLEIENALRHAVENEEFQVYYQPKLSLSDDTVCGAEALLRWVRPDQGMVSPAVFIPIAEECGLIGQIGEWVINHVCEQNKKWQDSGCRQIPIAVNMSGLQFSQSNIIDVVKQSFETPGLDPQWLEIEITESSIMQDAESTIHTLNAFRGMGLKLAIDDFGTGYSSLNYLKRFPIDYLKIDQSFIRDVCNDSSAAAIAKAIIALGHSLQLKVVAEGVEHDAEKLFLKDLNCDQMQGYLFSKPVPANEFVNFIKKT